MLNHSKGKSTLIGYHKIGSDGDEKLIIKLMKGDSSAFDEVVTTYQSMVINVCYGFSGNREDAEDIAQDVFIKIWEKIHSFKNEASLKTWIYRIAVNASLNFIRKQKFHALLENLDKAFLFAMEGHDPEEETRLKEQKNRVRKAIGLLPKNQRIAITLQHMNDLSYYEIAEIMETSVSSIESLIFRAKKNLRKKLYKYYFSGQ